MLNSLTQKFGCSDGCCQTTGWQVADAEDCRAYFRDRVAIRLRESDGSALLQEYIVELADTGFQTEGLEEQVAQPPVVKDWEIGEAFAGLFLEDQHKAAFPWPASLDKRTPKASLPGPDLVGFHRRQKPRFLFGEVKTSSQDDPRGLVTDGGDSLLTQLGRLVDSQAHRQQLIQWLLVKAKDTGWEKVFNEALKQYFTSGGRTWIVGIIIRGGKTPDASELVKAHQQLAKREAEFDIALIAVYLPFHKDEWVGLVYEEGGQN